MILALFHDTETTGLPLWKEPSNHPDQPHIVQLAALLVDADTGKTHASIGAHTAMADAMACRDVWLAINATAPAAA